MRKSKKKKSDEKQGIRLREHNQTWLMPFLAANGRGFGTLYAACTLPYRKPVKERRSKSSIKIMLLRMASLLSRTLTLSGSSSRRLAHSSRIKPWEGMPAALSSESGMKPQALELATPLLLLTIACGLLNTNNEHDPLHSYLATLAAAISNSFVYPENNVMPFSNNLMHDGNSFLPAHPGNNNAHPVEILDNNLIAPLQPPVMAHEHAIDNSTLIINGASQAFYDSTSIASGNINSASTQENSANTPASSGDMNPSAEFAPSTATQYASTANDTSAAQNSALILAPHDSIVTAYTAPANPVPDSTASVVTSPAVITIVPPENPIVSDAVNTISSAVSAIIPLANSILGDAVNTVSSTVSAVTSLAAATVVPLESPIVSDTVNTLSSTVSAVTSLAAATVAPLESPIVSDAVSTISSTVNSAASLTSALAGTTAALPLSTASVLDSSENQLSAVSGNSSTPAAAESNTSNSASIVPNTIDTILTGSHTAAQTIDSSLDHLVIQHQTHLAGH